MLALETWIVFFSASLALAFAPGPGMLYVLARTMEGGRRAGLLSTLGTALGGVFHVVAAAIGVSALIAASQTAFLILKIAGGVFLIYLGLRTLFPTREAPLSINRKSISKTSANNIFVQGVLTEALNPKTGAFFLAFIPQFVNPEDGPLFLQFVLLGLIAVLLNAVPDLLISLSSRPISVLLSNPLAIKIKRLFSGVCLISLGLYMMLFGVRNPTPVPSD